MIHMKSGCQYYSRPIIKLTNHIAGLKENNEK
jgi:hypothetical protein